MSKSLSLNDLVLDEVTRSYFMNYFKLTDSEDIDQVIIENMKSNADARALLTIVKSCQVLLRDQSPWGDPSATIIDFITSASDYVIGTPINFYEKTPLRNFLESKTDYLDDAFKLYTR